MLSILIRITIFCNISVSLILEDRIFLCHLYWHSARGCNLGHERVKTHWCSWRGLAYTGDLGRAYQVT